MSSVDYDANNIGKTFIKRTEPTITIQRPGWYQVAILGCFEESPWTKSGEKWLYLGVNGDPSGSPNMPQFDALGPTRFETAEGAMEQARHTPKDGWKWKAVEPVQYKVEYVFYKVTTETNTLGGHE